MIRSSTPHLLVGTQTHAGMTGKINEDRFGIGHYRMSSSNPTPVAFGVVCDGIGGQKSGEVAAELAVEAILKTISTSFGDQPLQTMLRAITLANDAIYIRAQESPHLSGHGSDSSDGLVGRRSSLYYIDRRFAHISDARP